MRPDKLLHSLKAKVESMLVRAAVELINDKLDTQQLQITIRDDADVLDDVEHWQPYGLSFHPPAGAEVLGLSLGGARQNMVALCVQEPEERPQNVQPREGGLYTKGAWRVFVDAQGTVCIGAKDSDQHAVLGDVLVELLTQLTVPTSMGPSGTPLNATRFREILSRHLVAR